MRRAYSTLLILLLLLGPFAVLLPANAESRLPACCRRHGNHHCLMNTAGVASAVDSSAPVLIAPAHCPLFPQGATSTGATQALAAASLTFLALQINFHPLVSRPVASLDTLLLAASPRAPPASSVYA
jgi:hypothetical protein